MSHKALILAVFPDEAAADAAADVIEGQRNHTR